MLTISDCLLGIDRTCTGTDFHVVIDVCGWAGLPPPGSNRLSSDILVLAGGTRVALTSFRFAVFARASETNATGLTSCSARSKNKMTFIVVCERALSSSPM